MYSPTNTVSDLCINVPLGDCSWKLAPQLNGMQAACGATSHIKEGMHHLWLITCKFGLSCALYTIKSLVNFSQLPVFYADSCRKKRNWFEKNKPTTNPISIATLHTEAADWDMPSSENTTVPPLSSAVQCPHGKLNFSISLLIQLTLNSYQPEATGHEVILLLGCTPQCNKW